MGGEDDHLQHTPCCACREFRCCPTRACFCVANSARVCRGAAFTRPLRLLQRAPLFLAQPAAVCRAIAADIATAVS